jgi:hypothetical protein
VGFEEELFLSGLFLRTAELGEVNARGLGERAQRVAEFDTVAEHHELEHVATGLAAVAIEHLLGGADGEGRGLFLVEGAQTLVVLARALELHGLADQFHEVGGREHLRLQVSVVAVGYHAESVPVTEPNRPEGPGSTTPKIPHRTGCGPAPHNTTDDVPAETASARKTSAPVGVRAHVPGPRASLRRGRGTSDVS